MKRIIIVGLGLFALFLGDITFAQEPGDKRVGFGLRGYYYNLEDVRIGDELYVPKSTGMLEGNLTFYPHRAFSVEFAAGYTQSDVTYTVSGLSGDFGEFRQYPILGTARIHLWNQRAERLSGFYFGAGVGYYINNHTISDTFENTYPLLNVQTDNSFGAHANGGFEIYLTDSVSLDLDAKYIFRNEADVTLSSPTLGSTTSEVDRKGWLWGLGIKYYLH